MPYDEPEIEARFADLVRRIEPRTRLLRAWPLTGGISAQVTAVEIEHADGRREKLVVRRHGEVDRRQNPRIAADEFRLLRALQAEGLPVPTPRYVDESGEVLGTPSLVVAFVEGSANFSPLTVADAAEILAHQLARIHAIDPVKWDIAYLPSQAERCAERLSIRPVRLDDGLEEGQIRRTLADAWPLPPRNRASLLHGDFWPGNALWYDGRLAGIIDWEDAALGDPLADLANSRLELRMLYGEDAMRRFTERYLALAPLDVTDLPYWDLFATLRPITGMPGWGLADDALHEMRAGLKDFISQALNALEPG